jgi:hypothetical protein
MKYLPHRCWFLHACRFQKVGVVGKFVIARLGSILPDGQFEAMHKVGGFVMTSVGSIAFSCFWRMAIDRQIQTIAYSAWSAGEGFRCPTRCFSK